MHLVDVFTQNNMCQTRDIYLYIQVLFLLITE